MNRNFRIWNFYLTLVKVVKPRTLRWVKQIAHMGALRNAYKILVGRVHVKRSLGRDSYRLEDNIKIHVTKICCEGVNLKGFSTESSSRLLYTW
jgi:hypothetical protein